MTDTRKARVKATRSWKIVSLRHGHEFVIRKGDVYDAVVNEYGNVSSPDGVYLGSMPLDFEEVDFLDDHVEVIDATPGQS